ncbi:MAG TPA: hypothetical protein VK631_13690 [Solirubrobacteraceae bacterium]|nr:hypothetical protein [Solirubrobacteraceae bacterium]
MQVNLMRSALTRDFARHYVEMVLVMLVGMGLLALPARWATDAVWPGVDGDDPTLMLGRMAATMTLPMIPWMRWRGNAWQPSLEMAAAMIVPAIGVIALLEGGVIEAVWLLMTIEHVGMFIAMFMVMIARPHEYSHARHETRDVPTIARAQRAARTD